LVSVQSVDEFKGSQEGQRRRAKRGAQLTHSTIEQLKITSTLVTRHW
jgi:hypothetical protein